MTAAQYALRDSGKIDFDAFRSDVNKHNFKAESSRSNHHLKVVLPGKRGLNREALTSLQISAGKAKNFPSRRDR